MAGLFGNPLKELKEYEELSEALRNRKAPVQVSGCMDSQKVHLMDALRSEYPYCLVVTYNELRAKEIYEDFKLFTREAALYPAKDLIFYNADVQGSLLARQRLSVLKAMREKQGGVIITTIDALMNALPSFDAIQKEIITIHSEQEINIDSFRKDVIRLGYECVVKVEEPGQFSVHGGIIDIFSMTEENPCRIELWGDEVDSIRYFDVESQRSIEQIDQIEIFPAGEIVLTEEQLKNGTNEIKKQYEQYYSTLKESGKLEEAVRIREQIELLLEELKEGGRQVGLESYLSFFHKTRCAFYEYFPKETTLICLDEPVRLSERAKAVELEFRESMTHRLEKGYLLPGQAEVVYSVDQTFAGLQRRQTVLISSLEQRFSLMKINSSYHIAVQNMNSYKNSFEMLIKDLTLWKKENYRVVILCGSRTRAERMAQDLREYQLRAYVSEEKERSLLPGEIMIASGSLHRGFCYPLLKFVVLTDGDVFGVEKKRRRKTTYQGQKINSFTDLSVGDYVIHESHGLGIYRGIEKVEIERTEKDYIKIEYGDGGNLYIPATQFHLVQKYSGKDGPQPKLNKLGGQEWTKTKKKVKKAVQEVARELVELYAIRENTSGYVYGPDTVWQKEFEEMFPYEETEDQIEAIEATKRDMESKKIMDRLICGDVGFGKTEVAIRAAFKVVQESRQVVYLVPTTILAQQHYNTFCQRMKDFPIRIELLSRFRTPTQIKHTLEDLKKGLVDIVIGTHRVLSKDVVFKDLGLLIIDEEQRFGVTHKEKIKQMKKNVDVLTLTATPIPRTLHMSLIGVRDMSVLEEAPSERQPIQTYVMEYNTEIIREAINRELARNGQVFYVYNQVKDIEEITNKIALLVPDANVAYAHGQMNERQLEHIMLDFINGEIDVLVATTIIETGLDISNVNTMIIHDSDRFGLSQLYQLRGRVGRSNRTSYAFIMYRKNKVLKEDAEKRLQAIREFTELGSGIKIAMRDLEIRGAGSLLGERQHGHIEAVGYDLYCKMLNEAVRTLKGEMTEKEEFDTIVDFSMDAYIPNYYIRNEYMKLDIYKRIAAIESEEELVDMQDELIDRFGDVPKPVQNLLQIVVIRTMAHQIYATEVKGDRKEIKILMYPKAKLQIEHMEELLNHYKGNALRLVTSGNVPYFICYNRKNENKDVEQMLNFVKKLLSDIKMLLVDTK